MTETDPTATPGSPARRRMPRLLAVFVALSAIAAVWAAAFGDVTTGLVEIAVVIGLALGHPWARWAALVVAVLSVLSVGIVLVAHHETLGARGALLGAIGLLELAWMFVLFRPDTAAFFAPR